MFDLLAKVKEFANKAFGVETTDAETPAELMSKLEEAAAAKELLGAQANDFSAMVEEHKNEITTLKASIETLQTSVNGMTEKISGYETQLQTSLTEIASIKTANEQLVSGLKDEVATAITQVKTGALNTNDGVPGETGKGRGGDVKEVTLPEADWKRRDVKVRTASGEKN